MVSEKKSIIIVISLAICGMSRSKALEKLFPYFILKSSQQQDGNGTRSVPPDTVALICDRFDARETRSDTDAYIARQWPCDSGVYRAQFYVSRDNRLNPEP